MSTSSNGLFRREGKVVVAALVLALLAMLCGPVGGSRFMESPASARRTMARLQQSPPPPPDSGVDDPLPPPPPDSVQFPPPIHHRVRPPPSNASSPPPVSLQPPSHPPPSRFHRSPPPPPSSPPPPPPDQDTRLTNSQNGRRRLLTSEHVADPNSSSDQELSGRNKFLTQADASPGKCTDADNTGVPLTPYGGAYVPVGAPFSYGDPGVPSPEPAPSPTSGADGPSNNPPTSVDNSTLAHTTMVSAMKFNQCTYTIITCTGNIEGAGTQADVNVEFFDKYGDSVLFVNLKSQNRNFNRGATDTFTVVGDCVQNICRMHLSHDDSGPNPGWFVNTVTVSLLYQTHVFNVFEWLAKDEPPYSLSRTVSSCPA